MNVDILISTYCYGITRVPDILLKERDDVNYIICYQHCDERFAFNDGQLKRRDVSVSHLGGKGVTKSRNYALSLSKSEIGVFSDDDVKYTDENINTVIKYHKMYSDFDIILFKISTPPGCLEYRDYDKNIKEYKKAPSVGTIEITFKTKRIKEGNIKFDERFGAGNDFLIGSDEQIFLYDCINAGLKILFVPEYIVEHPFESTIKTISKYDNRLIRVAGGLDARFNGGVAILKSLLGTIKFLPDLLQHKKNPAIYFWERFRAAVFITFTKATE